MYKTLVDFTFAVMTCDERKKINIHYDRWFETLRLRENANSRITTDLHSIYAFLRVGNYHCAKAKTFHWTSHEKKINSPRSRLVRYCGRNWNKNNFTCPTCTRLTNYIYFIVIINVHFFFLLVFFSFFNRINEVYTRPTRVVREKISVPARSVFTRHTRGGRSSSSINSDGGYGVAPVFRVRVANFRISPRRTYLPPLSSAQNSSPFPGRSGEPGSNRTHPEACRDPPETVCSRVRRKKQKKFKTVPIIFPWSRLTSNFHK